MFFDAAEVTRQVISRLELLMTFRLMQSYEGCEHVRVIDVTRLEREDEAGCNWSSSIVLATGGVEAEELYVLAYAQAVTTARESWNLE